MSTGCENPGNEYGSPGSECESRESAGCVNPGNEYGYGSTRRGSEEACLKLGV